MSAAVSVGSVETKESRGKAKRGVTLIFLIGKRASDFTIRPTPLADVL